MSAHDGNSVQLESDLLRTFLAVAAAGSVSGGATRLFRTQSAVSLQVQKLEETVGQRLFERHGRGVSMTAAGEQLLPVARRVVETLNQTVVAMRGVQSGGELRLGIPEEYGDTILPSILAAFTAQQPNARMFLRCGSSTDFPRMLAAGGLDLALHSPENVATSDVVVHREAAVWVGSDFHDVENRRPLPVALFDKTCWWRERCLDLLQKSGVEYQVVCSSESVAGVRAAIAAGVAVGVLPQSSLTGHLRLLPEAILPNLGETNLVLSRSLGAPAQLTDILAAIVAKTLRMISPS
jgi:DNA-binding transcriptional LysR family regulator